MSVLTARPLVSLYVQSPAMASSLPPPALEGRWQGKITGVAARLRQGEHVRESRGERNALATARVARDLAVGHPQGEVRIGIHRGPSPGCQPARERRAIL